MVLYRLEVASQPILKLFEGPRSRSLRYRRSANTTLSVVSRPSPVTACLTSAETRDSDEPSCKWSVQVAQDWDAVKNLIKVTHNDTTGLLLNLIPSISTTIVYRRSRLLLLRSSTRARAFGL